MSERSAQWTTILRHFDDLVDEPSSVHEARIAALNLDDATRASLRSLLAASSRPGPLDGVLASELAADLDARSLMAGDQIGGFTVDKLIGRGGMGDVYLAHRQTPDFVQKVAIKVLRSITPDQARQFAREQRLLAGLEHPNIARLIDGGLATDGRPYMAIEYVDGLPITDWCRGQGADRRSRLQLVREVCDAVAYAHSQLVVHRDLKPSNILVDSRGHVRLLDFGIARLLDSADNSRTTQMVLTPDYAAPEQLLNERATVATDVYSLGAVLYELLTDRRPWQAQGSSLPTLMRRIVNEEPAKPSEVARQSSGPVAANQLVGDLDAIVRRAMRPTPSDRYPSVAALSDDLTRHLTDQPVRARDGSTRYVVGRFLRRHRGVVAVGTLALVGLIAGGAGIAWQARKAAAERDLAVAESKRSEAINQALTVMFRESQSSGTNESLTVKEMLAKSADRLVDSLDNSADSVALITTIADLYVFVEDSLASMTLLERAKAKGMGAGNAVALAELDMRIASGKAIHGKADEARPLIDSAWRVFGADRAKYPKQALETIAVQAQVARAMGDLNTAIRLLRDSLDDAERVYQEDHREILTRYNNLMAYLLSANQLDDMPTIYKRATAAVDRFQLQRTRQSLNLQQSWGGYLTRMGDVDAAADVFAAIVDQRRQISGSDMGLAVDLLQLGRTRLAQRQFDAAAAAFTEARPIAVAASGPSSPYSLLLGLSLAEVRFEAGQAAAGEQLLKELEPLVMADARLALMQGTYFRTRAISRLLAGSSAAALADVDRAEAKFAQAGSAAATFSRTLPQLRARIAETKQR